MTKTNFARTFLFLSVMFLLVGCGKRQTTVLFDQPEVPFEGYWETAWVEPQVLISDTLFSLIRAARVDSFFVDNPKQPLELSVPSVRFTVPQGGCFVSVNLLNDREQIVRPLIARNLTTGHYKVTADVSIVNYRQSVSGIYFLKAQYCDRVIIERIARQ